MTITSRRDEDSWTPEAVAAKRAGRQLAWVQCSAALGVVLAVVGIITGVAMAFHRTVVDCANGTFFPSGTTDFRCFSYPHVGEGVAIAVLAAIGGIVAGLAGFIALVLIERTPPVPAATDDASSGGAGL